MTCANIIQFPSSKLQPSKALSLSAQDIAEDALASTAEMQNDLCLFRGDLRDMLSEHPNDKNVLAARILAMREIMVEAEIKLTKALQDMKAAPATNAV